MGESSETAIVRHFRHILLWPLQLRVEAPEPDCDKPWELLAKQGAPAWRPVVDAFEQDPAGFKERHYKEFVSFLPYVQRFLYGEMRGRRLQQSSDQTESPMRVMRRHDVAALRACLRPGDEAINLQVERMDLHFFHDMDVVLLVVELSAENIALSTAQELLYRFGRAYPSGWDESGQGLHNLYSAEWLGPDGRVLVRGDSGDRDRFLRFVGTHRTPGIAQHWAFLLRPLVLDVTDDEGALRYRQLEYHRMPLMAYLAMENPRAIDRDDIVRLGLITSLRPGEALPRNDPAVAEFEQRHCDDRYWTNTEHGPNTRFLCTGGALIVIGDASSKFFRDANNGLLAQFTHQYFLLFLMAHFHRAVLLLFSGYLVDAISDMNVRDADSVRRFKRRIRGYLESFLRFTHRYWFHELSERGQVQALFRRCAAHLGNDRLYEEVKEEIREMSEFLDSDSQRRQANTVVRLTVVTTFGLIATITTGFLGMNLIAAADWSIGARTVFFLVASILTTGATVLAVVLSKRLSDVLEVLSDQRLNVAEKLHATIAALHHRRQPGDD